MLAGLLPVEVVAATEEVRMDKIEEEVWAELEVDQEVQVADQYAELDVCYVDDILFHAFEVDDVVENLHQVAL